MNATRNAVVPRVPIEHARLADSRGGRVGPLDSKRFRRGAEKAHAAAGRGVWLLLNRSRSNGETLLAHNEKAVGADAALIFNRKLT